jgi:hypothetical protein
VCADFLITCKKQAVFCARQIFLLLGKKGDLRRFLGLVGGIMRFSGKSGLERKKKAFLAIMGLHWKEDGCFLQVDSEKVL